MTRRTAKGRHALTLLEVIVAMAIFLISVIAIFQLLFLGTERAVDVRLQTRTSMRCQAKLAEIMVGAENLNASASYTNFPDGDIDKDLQWKIEATPNDDKQLLWTVKVWVKSEMPSGKIVESHLCQLVLNPAMRGTTFDQPQQTPAGTPSTDTTPDPSATPDTSTGKSGTKTGAGAGTGGGTKTGAGATKTGAGAATGGVTKTGTGAEIGGGTKTGTGAATGAGAKTGTGGGNPVAPSTPTPAVKTPTPTPTPAAPTPSKKGG
jgi:Tfp pilus assembly protein PilV